jgi:hypothetical protein
MMVKNTHPWWDFVTCIEELNQRYQDILETPVWWLIVECISAFCPHKTKNGRLPNISYIEHNQNHQVMFLQISD